MTEDLLSTGLFTLDKELDGGLYPGTLVYLKADSMAMAGTFLYQFLQQTSRFLEYS
jgi:archaellum biogenesis ATPase FlaH